MKEKGKIYPIPECQLINNGNRKSSFDSHIKVINSGRNQERMPKLVSEGLKILRLLA